jgi:phosphoribosyl 1,2-cyclic phosphodiesterase
MAELRFRLLASGSSGNATIIEAGTTRLLIDAGLGPRVLAGRLRAAGIEPETLAAVLLTHEHVDHLKGVGGFARKWGVPVVSSRGTRRACGIGEAEAGGPTFELVRPGEPFDLGGVRVTPVAIPHDAAGPLAFVIEVGSVRLGHVTDLGHVTPDVTAAFGRCHALVVEANHDVGLLRENPHYPFVLKERIVGPHGHLSNRQTAVFLRALLGRPEDECRTVVLAHLSERNNAPDLALATIEPEVRRASRHDVRLEVAGRDGTPSWIDVRAPRAARREKEPHGGQYRLW